MKPSSAKKAAVDVPAEPPGRRARKQTWDRATHLRREGKYLARKFRYRVAAPALWALGDRLRDLDGQLKQGKRADRDWESFVTFVRGTDQLIEQHLGFARKSDTRRNAEAISAALLIALFIRAFMFEPYRIPSGSMIPTLFVGDYLFVAKFTYGLKIPFTDTVILDWRKPKKGEIVIFEHPEPEQKREILIKRVMAEPGDQVRMVDNVWYINGEPWGQPKVLSRDQACFLPPGQRCRTVVRTSSGHELGDAGCTCEFIELTDGTNTWVTQHVLPGPGCACSDPDDHTSCLPFGGKDPDPNTARPFQNMAHWPSENSQYLRGWPWSFSKPASGPSEPESFIRTVESGIEMVVPGDHVLVLGDNRDNSGDSRMWGLVPMNLVRGRALFIWLNTSHPSRMFHSVN